MANKIGELFVGIYADTKKFDDGIDKAKKGTEKFNTGLGNLSGTVKKLLGAGAIIALASKIKDIGVASIGAASDAQETQNKFNVVFSSMSDDANDMAIALSGSYGLSQQAAKDMLAGTGDLLVGLGFTQDSALDLSTQVLTLGADLASFTNYSGGAEGASEALTKALLGERDMLKGLGISINEADLKAQVLLDTENGLTFATEKQAKASATLTLVMAQSQNAMGDFERSQDSFANKTKIAEAAVSDLKVELGRSLLPTATSVTSIFGELTGKLADYIREVNNLRDAEKALEEGESSRQQELTILESKLEVTTKELKNQLLSQEATDKRLALAGIVVSAEEKANSLLGKSIALKQRSIDDTERAITATKAEIQSEVDLADKKSSQAVIDKENAQAREQQQTAEEQLYKKNVSAIDDIIRASKSKIEIIDDEIAQLNNFDGLDEESKAKQAEAIRLLQQEKITVLDEERVARQEANLQAEFDNDARNEKILAGETESAKERAEIAKELAEQKKEVAFSVVDAALEIADALSQISSNSASLEIEELNRVANEKTRLLDLETEQDTALSDYKKLIAEEKLERETGETEKRISDLILMGDEDSIQTANELQRDLDIADNTRTLEGEAVTARDENNAKKLEIEKQAALDIWKIEKDQFEANKQLSLVTIAINTAIGASKAWAQTGIFGAVAAATVVAGGLAQVAVVNSTNPPPKPAFAKGGTVTGATSIIAGEDKGDVLLGMGAKGSPLIDELAARIASKSGGGQTVININSLYPPRSQDLERLARDLYNPNVKELQRRGI